ncbi:hypothetical protein CSHISOI_04421, partial [Colletotrichum shisoi]
THPSAYAAIFTQVSACAAILTHPSAYAASLTTNNAYEGLLTHPSVYAGILRSIVRTPAGAVLCVAAVLTFYPHAIVMVNRA